MPRRSAIRQERIGTRATCLPALCPEPEVVVATRAALPAIGLGRHAPRARTKHQWGREPQASEPQGP
eukprot:319092-Pyramimonas_sp.AAC.1